MTRVADQEPSPSNESVRDDDEREHERDEKDGAPEPRRPTEKRGECLPDLLVGTGSGPSDNGFEPDHRGHGRDQNPVDGPPVSTTRLGRNEQCEAP